MSSSTRPPGTSWPNTFNLLLKRSPCYNVRMKPEVANAMAQPKILEGTGEELQRHLQQFPNDRFLLTPLPVTSTQGPEEEQSDEGSLFDLLSDYIGSVEGNGESNAANHSELFKDYVQAKRKEGHL
jgi:hypothetical protein